MELGPDISASAYLAATVLFIFGLKGLSSPKTALTGNTCAMLGMGIAIVVTLLHPDVKNYNWIIAGLLSGATLGALIAYKIQMTAMPQLVAALHSFVGLSALLISFGTYFNAEEVSTVLAIELSLGSAIAAITFTGSVMAFGKLQGILGSSPLIFRGQHFLNLIILLATIAFTVQFALDPQVLPFILLTVLALMLGVLVVLPIGGADMPVVVSMLNSYSGWAASATGFTLGNNLLIATGALVGSSGAILSYIMCKAMNRSIVSVILGGFGTESAVVVDQENKKPVKSAAPEDVAFSIENAEKIIVVPGYGMAIAQAQHALKEMFTLLQKKGIEMKFAIHPVAGRMPGHMNVLLAESDIPYDSVEELEEINNSFSTTDVVLVVGANDIVNPAALTNKNSPLFGMPILETHKARQVYMLKRSMGSGYSGVDNDLFYYDNCSLVFGDAKSTCSAIVRHLNESDD